MIRMKSPEWKKRAARSVFYVLCIFSLVNLVSCSDESKSDSESARTEDQTSDSKKIGIINEITETNKALVVGAGSSNQVSDLFDPNNKDVNSNTADGVNSENQEGSLSLAIAEPCHKEENSFFKLINARCAACHADGSSSGAPKYIFSSDPVKTCVDLYAGQKVSLTDPKNSSLYIKLVSGGGHNCWNADCEASGAEMSATLQVWADKVKELNAQEQAKILKSSSLKFVDGPVAPPFSDGPSAIIVEAEAAEAQFANVADNRFIIQMSENASGNKAIYVDANNNAGCVAGNSNFDQAGNNIRLDFEVPVAGTYFFYGLMAAQNQSSDSFHYRIDGDPNQTYIWRPEVNNANDMFVWNKATTANDVASLLNGVTLTAGAHYVEFRCREANTRLDAIAISTSDSFEGSDVLAESEEKMLTFDMTEQCGVPATMEIRVSIYGEDGYRFRLPVLKSETPLTVRKLDIYVNNIADPSNTTYHLLNADIPANSTEPMQRGALIVRSDKGSAVDEFSFAFQDCAATPAP